MCAPRIVRIPTQTDILDSSKYRRGIEHQLRLLNAPKYGISREIIINWWARRDLNPFSR